MTLKAFLKQYIYLFCLHLICIVSLSLFLLANKLSIDSILFIIFIWVSILILYLIKTYISRKKYFNELLDLLDSLDESYLISEIMKKPENIYDQIYYKILKTTSKSMLEKIDSINRERVSYKEYIEQWIHEIKNPITAIRLICENNRSNITKSILLELEKTNLYTEQALYYARSEYPEKDYSIHEIRIFDVVHEAISQNKYMLIENRICIDLEETEDIIYSDEKWLCFIINQLISNAIKYRSDNPNLKFYIKKHLSDTILLIEDNGIGISDSDLPRIFEKGFTGKNGRNNSQNSTGMGLYICKSLCNKLGIKINAYSENRKTIFQLIFHTNDFIKEVQD